MDKVTHDLINALVKAPQTEHVPLTQLITDIILPPIYHPILSIGIFTHGEIMVTSDGTPVRNENFPNVILHKQNAGAYGCVTFSGLYYDKKADFNRKCRATNISLLSLKTGLNYAYQKTYASFTKEKTHPLHCTEGTCRLFTNKDKYYEKQYIADDLLGNMILSYATDTHMVSINLMRCDAAMLLSAVGMSEESLQVCNEFCDKRDSYSNPIITTTELNKIIALFKTYRLIQQVNILDLSCNVMRATPRNGTNTYDGYGAYQTCFPAEEDVGWGGKSRKSHKSRRKIK
jgi:hypothetical protein